jgi:imidazoleglycerol-phosphate dehydratase/histidinol-phosphatase
MKKVLFIDRDGTILKEPVDEQIDSLEKLEFIPGVISALSAIVRETDFELVMVTNQDGLGTPAFPENEFLAPHNKMLSILEGEGVKFAAQFIDRSFEKENSPYRKPGTAMLTQYLAQGIDLSSSYVIGDRFSDIELARNLGCRSIYISSEKNDEATLCTRDWDEIRRFLKKIPRRAVVTRKTSETMIETEVTLDGTGRSSITTGIGFLDHMLDQMARHGSIDISLKATGDLGVDEHHLVEDVAIVVGEAFNIALGSKKGIGRYGFTLPMDDSLAQVTLDFGGRPWLTWDVVYRSERVGNIPSEMFPHFFRSFSDSAKCNIHVHAAGDNEHHKTEAIFKAFGRAVRMAVAATDNGILPTTKGQL